jgi:hypothetical protein
MGHKRAAFAKFNDLLGELEEFGRSCHHFVGDAREADNKFGYGLFGIYEALEVVNDLFAIVFVHGQFRDFGVFGVATCCFDIDNDIIHVYEVRKKRGSAFLYAFKFFVFFDKKLISMKTSLLVILLLSQVALFAQSNLSIFNNNGQQFYVVLNGIRQNSKPETNVQVGQIKNGSYAVKVIFADGKTPDIGKNFMIDAPYDITARIIFKKGKGKLQLIGQEPTHGVIQEAVVYRPSDAAVYSDAIVVNANASGTGVGTSTSVSETTITSSSSVSSSSSTISTTSTQGHTVNCTQTMNRLEAFKAELQDQSFEDDRLEALKLGLNKTCLTTAQAAQFLDLFSFDENRLEAAKYLSDRLTDRASAGELAKKLNFDSSKMEYRRYISE